MILLLDMMVVIMKSLCMAFVVFAILIIMFILIALNLIISMTAMITARTLFMARRQGPYFGPVGGFFVLFFLFWASIPPLGTEAQWGWAQRARDQLALAQLYGGHATV